MPAGLGVLVPHRKIFERYMHVGAITRNPDAIAAMFTKDGVYRAPLVPDGRPLRRVVGRDPDRNQRVSPATDLPGHDEPERFAHVLHDTPDPDVLIPEIDVAFDQADRRRTTMALVQIFRLRDGQIVMLRDYFAELQSVASDGHSN